MILLGRREIAWVSGFQNLGINTNLVCLELTGIYFNAKVARNNIRSLPANSSKPCYNMPEYL
jgi:hypothetical protein